MTRFSVLAAFAALALAPLSAMAGDQSTAVQPDELKWAAGPAALPMGAQIAMLLGDPAKKGVFAYRLKLPATYKVPPHAHPVDESVTVLSGELHIATGDRLDWNKGEALRAGGFIHIPTGVHHYAWTTEETVIQVNSIGPSGVTYVNRADDPRKTK